MLNLFRKLWKPEDQPQSRRPRIQIPAERVADIFAIGDIHGRIDLLLDAEARIRHRMRNATAPALVVCVGDYVDRGPESSAVIAHLIEKIGPPLYRICVCGNHDAAFLNAVSGERFDVDWLGFGGDKTLQSYGIDAEYLLSNDATGKSLKQEIANRIPAAHLRFLEELPVAVTIGNRLFVHAGIVPGKPLEAQSDIDLMWIREPFLAEGPGLDLTVIHGHTPASRIQYGPGRIGIDTGAFATGRLDVLHIGPDGLEEI
jgi:serine/threonine protein phosphatase 1